jgi:hypothetical protein
MTTTVVDAMFNTMESLRKQKNAGFEDEEKRKKAKQADEDRALEMSERKRLLETRAELEGAAAPAQVEPVQIDGPVREGEAQPQGLKINGQVALTDEPAKAYNAPQAVASRMAEVMQSKANPEGAQKIRTGLLAEKMAGLNVAKAEREGAEDDYLTDLRKSVPFGDWDAASTFMNRSRAGGDVQGRFVLSPDKKKRIAQSQGPDGQWQTVAEYDNTPDGFADLAMRLENVPPEKMALHLDRKQQRQETKRYHDAQIGNMATGRNLQMRADGRAQAEFDAGAPARELAMEEARLQSQARSQDPAVREAAQTRLRELAEIKRMGSGRQSSSSYKFDGGEVSSALGVPATDARGRAITDPMSGRQVVNRNPEEEVRFAAWMQQNGFTDSNEALPKYLALRAKPQASGSGGGDLLAQARAAVERGADKAKVNERLKAQGLPPLP